jgi:F-type H+-transporting ATPase subunit epsilon
MAAGDSTFHLSVITPEAQVLDLDVHSASFQAHDGEIGLLPKRAPLMCQLGIGTLRYAAPTGSAKLFIDGGFAQVVDNEVTVLTQSAKLPEEIDAAAARKDLDAAHEMKNTDEAAYQARNDAIRRAQVQIKLAGK